LECFALKSRTNLDALSWHLDVKLQNRWSDWNNYNDHNNLIYYKFHLIVTNNCDKLFKWFDFVRFLYFKIFLSFTFYWSLWKHTSKLLKATRMICNVFNCNANVSSNWRSLTLIQPVKHLTQSLRRVMQTPETCHIIINNNHALIKESFHFLLVQYNSHRMEP